jgi:hypothetical protein
LSTPPCLQVCGFIALYLHLAALASATCIAQPQAQLASAKWMKWLQLLPLTIVAGLVMWLSLLLHQGCCSAREEIQLSVSQQKGKAPVSSVIGNDMADTMAFHMYTGAHQLTVDLAQKSAQHEPGTYSSTLASIRELLDQLRTTLNAAQRVVYVRRETHNNVPHTYLAQPLSEVWGCGFQIARLCDQLVDLSLQDSCKNSAHVSLNSLISMTTAVSARINNPDFSHPLPSALRHAEGLHTELGDDHMTHELLEWQKEHLQALDLPSAASILQAFPPPPPELQQWTTFHTISCPVSLGKQMPAYWFDPCFKPWFPPWCERVELPSSPEASAPADQVEAYVAETKAQLGASFHALAPVAAAINHRPKPWVGYFLPYLPYHHWLSELLNASGR